MNRKENINRKWYVIAGIIGGILLIGLFLLSFVFWEKYKKTIINSHKDLMLVTVEALSNSMESALMSYADDAEILAGQAYLDDGSVNTQAFSEYLVNRDFVTNLILYNPKDQVVFENHPETFPVVHVICVMRQTGILFEAEENDEGKLKFVFRQRTQNGSHIEVVMDVEKYYSLISNIMLGHTGYLVLKTSSGIILMHPEKDLIGLNAIDGRLEKYAQSNKKIDLSSLKQVTTLEETGNSGTAEYYSYDWMNAGLHRTRKISAFDPVRIGDDFFVLSGVMNYDEVYEPLARGFSGIVGLIVAIAGIIICFIVFAFYLARRNQKNSEEIQYLKDLNNVLEETHKSEEALAHQQRLQIMGTMTGGIAHEFNNMLTPIMGYADMLMSEMPEDSDEYDNAKEIFDASEKARDIIRQISSLSRKNMETAFHYIEAKKFLQRSIKMIVSICPQGIQLKREIRIDNGEGFLGNTTQMDQVLLNLCVNAFHAIGDRPNGEVDLCADVVPRSCVTEDGVREVSEFWEKYIRIAISDNGCGMDEETKNQIFTPFFTTKASGKGTGLGLSIVDKIVDSHKGYITVKSTKGEGSVFTVYIPVAVRAEETAEKEIPSPAENLKLVVVDENPKVLQLLYKDFQKLGIQIKTAKGTRDAARILLSDEYDAIVVDNSLSQTGYDNMGIDFAMSIVGRYPHLIKVIMTDKIQKEVLEAKQEGIIDAYLEKPVSVSQIIEVIKAAAKESGEDAIDRYRSGGRMAAPAGGEQPNHPA